MVANNNSENINLIFDKDILFAKENPTTIAYAKDFSLAINEQIEYLALTDFEEIIRQNPLRKKFCWSENLTLDKKLLNKKIIVKANYIDGKYYNTIESLVVVNMGPVLGYGVMTINPIPKGAIITHYAGIVEQENDQLKYENLTSAYRMSYFDYSIDAIEFGNIACFMQDAPTEHELKNKYLLNPELATQIATANTDYAYGLIDGQAIVYLHAIRDIAAGEMLFINYGESYWNCAYLLNNIQRFLLMKDGKLAPAGKYQYTGGNIKLKYDENNFVEVAYVSLLPAYQKQQPIYYEFTPNSKKKEKRILDFADLCLIMQPTLGTTIIDPEHLPLKFDLMTRLHKEFRLQKILWPLYRQYHAAYYDKALAMMSDKEKQRNDNQIIAFLLQALFLAIKEARPYKVLAIIYYDLSRAYANKAYKEKNINSMQSAIYLAKESIKLEPASKKKQQLREYKRWLRKNAALRDYWDDYCASFAVYLQTL